MMRNLKNLFKYFNLILFMINIQFNCVIDCISSGFYYDNGIDSTQLLRHINKYEMNRLENDIMDLIGIPSKRNPGHLMSLGNSAPRFLLNVYDKLTNNENSVNFRRYKRNTIREDDLISDIDEKAFQQSDIIMAFLHKDHQISEVRHEHGRRLWFDITEVSRDAVLMMAELRIFQKSQPLGNWNRIKKHIVITAYSIVKADGQKELEIISSVNTTTEYHGWLEMDVTDALQKWLHNRKDNNGLYISAHEIGRPRHEIKLSDIGYVNVHGDEAYQTFMVAYFKGREINKIPKSFHRIKRDSFSYKPKHSFVNFDRLQKQFEEIRECKLHFLHVSFDELPSFDNIIAPSGYEAYYCKGECAFPLNSHMNATSHAIVQALVHLLVGGVPKPSCAPLKLGAIQILYVADENNVILKKVKNMVVKRCGCQ